MTSSTVHIRALFEGSRFAYRSFEVRSYRRQCKKASGLVALLVLGAGPVPSVRKKGRDRSVRVGIEGEPKP